jgi:hypothetical protein
MLNRHQRMGDSPIKGDSLVIGDLDPDDPAWRRLVSSALGATPVHDPLISQVAALAPGCQWSALGVWRDGQLVGGVAVVSNEHGDVWPQSLAPYNSPLIAPLPGALPATRYRHESAVAGALLGELATRHRFVSLRLRPRSIDVRKIVESGWKLTTTFTYEIDVVDLERAWRNIDDNRRRLIRRAERLGCTVREASGYSVGLVEEVNRLHRMMRDGYRTSTDLDEQGWHQALQLYFEAGLARLLTVSDAGGDVVAFVLTTNTRPVSTLLATGADPSRLDSGAGALLRWRMLCELSSGGVETVDLNGARIGPEGRFKASFGGELVDRWELSTPAGSFPSGTSGTRLRSATGVLFGRRTQSR